MSGQDDIQFQKYPSIENCYHQKHIDMWRGYFPELDNELFVLQEKMHGANIQFEVEPGGQCRVFSRKQQIGKMYIKRHPDSSLMLEVEGYGIDFQGADIIEIVTERLDGITLKFLNELLKLAEGSRCIVRAYGELCGPKIQKGVYYCDDPTIYFYDLSLNGVYLTPVVFYGYMIEYGEITVNTIDTVRGLNEAISYDISEFCHQQYPDNIIEGVVIKPLYEKYQTDNSIFYLKKKNERFKEKQKSPKETKPIDEKLVRLNNEFLNYITYARIENVFSKHETISAPSQIGDYIKLIMKDAIDDFAKDHDDEFKQLNKQERKHVVNAGTTIATKLKEYL